MPLIHGHAARRLNPRHILIVWTGIGLLLALQPCLVQLDTVHEWTLKGSLFTSMAQMYRDWLWAALTPLVLGMRRELIRRYQSRAIQAALHLLTALTMTARRSCARLPLLVTNDTAKSPQVVARHGIGLRTTRSRRQSMYNGEHQLDCVLNGTEGTVVSTEIPFRTVNA